MKMDKQKLNRAIKTNSFCDFLCGYGDFAIPDREAISSTDRTAVLHGYSFEAYKKDKSIRERYTKSLRSLLNGTLFEFMTAFDYITEHKLSQLCANAPFAIDASCMELLVLQLGKREAALKAYKEHNEFGALLQEGAWEYIQNMKHYFAREYGADLFAE